MTGLVVNLLEKDLALFKDLSTFSSNFCMYFWVKSKCPICLFLKCVLYFIKGCFQSFIILVSYTGHGWLYVNEDVNLLWHFSSVAPIDDWLMIVEENHAPCTASVAALETQCTDELFEKAPRIKGLFKSNSPAVVQCFHQQVAPTPTNQREPGKVT